MPNNEDTQQTQEADFQGNINREEQQPIIETEKGFKITFGEPSSTTINKINERLKSPRSYGPTIKVTSALKGSRKTYREQLYGKPSGGRRTHKRFHRKTRRTHRKRKHRRTRRR